MTQMSCRSAISHTSRTVAAEARVPVGLSGRVSTTTDTRVAASRARTAASNLPDPDELAALRPPTLILAWDPDPAHPRSTADELAKLMPHAELEVALDLGAVRAWPARVERFLTALPG